MVLELARPSEPWCFAAGSCFFRSYCTGISSSSRHLRAAAGDRLSRKKLFFQDFKRHQQQQPPPPVLRAAAGNRICRQMLDISRFPDDTLGSFFAWFWTLLVLPSHGVLLPGAAFFEAVLPASAAAAAATSSASSRR